MSLPGCLLAVSVGAAVGAALSLLGFCLVFWPRQEKRLFGFRVPFTPGLLMRHRAALIEKAADLAQRELASPEIQRRHLSSPSVREALRSSLSAATDAALARPFGEGSGGFVRAGALLGGRFAASEAFASLAASAVDSIFDRLEGKTLNDLFGALGPSLGHRLFSPENETRAAAAARAWILDRAASGKSPADLLPFLNGGTAEDWAQKAYPLVAETLLRFLHESGTRKELEIRGRFFLKDALEELNTVQRFLLSAAQYDKTLDAKMPVFVDDIIAQAEELSRDAETKRRFAQAAGAALAAYASRPLEVTASALGIDPGAAAEAASRLLFGVLRASFAEKGAGASALAGFMDKPVLDLLRDGFGVDAEVLKRAAAAKLVALVREGGAGSALAVWDSFVRAQDGRPAFEVLALTPADKAALDDALLEAVVSLMLRHPSSMNIREGMRERGNSFDLGILERFARRSGAVAAFTGWGALAGALSGLAAAFGASLLR